MRFFSSIFFCSRLCFIACSSARYQFVIAFRLILFRTLLVFLHCTFVCKSLSLAATSFLSCTSFKSALIPSAKSLFSSGLSFSCFICISYKFFFSYQYLLKCYLLSRTSYHVKLVFSFPKMIFNDRYDCL